MGRFADAVTVEQRQQLYGMPLLRDLSFYELPQTILPRVPLQCCKHGRGRGIAWECMG